MPEVGDTAPPPRYTFEVALAHGNDSALDGVVSVCTVVLAVRAAAEPLGDAVPVDTSLTALEPEFRTTYVSVRRVPVPFPVPLPFPCWPALPAYRWLTRCRRGGCVGRRRYTASEDGPVTVGIDSGKWMGVGLTVSIISTADPFNELAAFTTTAIALRSVDATLVYPCPNFRAPQPTLLSMFWGVQVVYPRVCHRPSTRFALLAGKRLRSSSWLAW